VVVSRRKVFDPLGREPISSGCLGCNPGATIACALDLRHPVADADDLELAGKKNLCSPFDHVLAHQVGKAHGVRRTVADGLPPVGGLNADQKKPLVLADNNAIGEDAN